MTLHPARHAAGQGSGLSSTARHDVARSDDGERAVEAKA